MLVPHFHFKGCCEEAMSLYGKAFNTTADIILYNKDMSGNSNDTGIGHAEMHIHGQRVMLNDRFGSSGNHLDTPVQIVMIFTTEESLLRSYNIMKEGITIIDPLQKASYSPLVTVFIDKFGIQWAFMVDKNIQE